MMREFDLIIEQIIACGGPHHPRRQVLEVEAESPEAYVRAHSQMPITSIEVQDGVTTITTGNGNGYVTRYLFSL